LAATEHGVSETCFRFVVVVFAVVVGFVVVVFLVVVVVGVTVVVRVVVVVVVVGGTVVVGSGVDGVVVNPPATARCSPAASGVPDEHAARPPTASTATTPMTILPMRTVPPSRRWLLLI
jgi:hypothetical protein